jgi:hypothetical protein
MESKTMKPAIKMRLILLAIILVIVFLVVTQCILWSNLSEKPDIQTYNSLDEFIEENSDSEYTYDILAQNDEYAVCLGSSYGAEEFRILSKESDGKYQVLNESFDYDLKSYSIKNNNADLIYIYNFKMNDNNDNIVMVWKVSISEEYGEYVFDESDRKLNRVGDTHQTIFYYKAILDKNPGFLNVIYTGFVEDLDKENYVLYINENEYPYSEWRKLFESY